MCLGVKFVHYIVANALVSYYNTICSLALKNNLAVVNNVDEVVSYGAIALCIVDFPYNLEKFISELRMLGFVVSGQQQPNNNEYWVYIGGVLKLIDRKDKRFMKKLYISAFPKCERFPFWLLVRCSKSSNVSFKPIVYKGIAVGIIFMVKYDNINYVMYLAIKEELRGMGYGSEIVKDLVSRGIVILSIEKPDEANTDSKIKRRNFYLRNGMYDTGYTYVDKGVEYSVLSSDKDFLVTKDVMKKRYTRMSTNFILRFLIKKLYCV